jgi:hypothetical protein
VIAFSFSHLRATPRAAGPYQSEGTTELSANLRN